MSYGMEPQIVLLGSDVANDNITAWCGNKRKAYCLQGFLCLYVVHWSSRGAARGHGQVVE